MKIASLVISAREKRQLTLFGFFCYIFTGGLVVLTGMVIAPVAAFYHVDVSKAGSVFTWMNLGILLAIISNSFLTNIISLKSQIRWGVLFTILAFIGLLFSHSLMVFCLLIFLFGLTSGITMAIATCLVAHLYSGRIRGMMFLLTDSFFSLAGIIFPFIAGLFLKNGLSWHLVYVMVLTTAIIILLLTIGVNFPSLESQCEHQSIFRRLYNEVRGWGIAVYVAALGCMFYILGQLSLAFWLPQYTVSNFDVSAAQSSLPLSAFWLGMLLGLYFSSFLVKHVPMVWFLLSVTLGSTLALFILRHASSMHMLLIECVIMGLFSSGIYYTLITLASLQVKVPSPLLVNFALTMGTAGTFLTPMVAAKAVSIGGIKAALTVGNAFYLLVFIATIVIAMTSKHKLLGHRV